MKKSDQEISKTTPPAKKKPVKKAVKKKSNNNSRKSDKTPKNFLSKEKKEQNNTISEEKKKGGAPKGNQFWKQRSKHGADKLFASAELMKEAAEEYFEWSDNNPINDPRSFGGLAMIPRPYTLHGLTAFLGVNTGYFRDFKAALKEDEKDFSAVIRYIEEIIYNQKYSHAAIGIYKENLIARDLGITDKMDVTSKGEKLNNAPPVVQVFSGAPPMADSEDKISEDKTEY